MHQSEPSVASSLLPAVSFPEHGHWTGPTHYLLLQDAKPVNYLDVPSIKFDNAFNKYSSLLICWISFFHPLSATCFFVFRVTGGGMQQVKQGGQEGSRLLSGQASPLPLTFTPTGYSELPLNLTSNDSGLWQEAGAPGENPRRPKGPSQESNSGPEFNYENIHKSMLVHMQVYVDMCLYLIVCVNTMLLPTLT